MDAVEFLPDPEAPPPTELAPGAAPTGPSFAALAASGCALIGAGLAAVAASQRVYAIGFGNGNGDFHFSVDAGGHYLGGGAAAASAVAPDYALVLWICAAALVALGGLSVVAAFARADAGLPAEHRGQPRSRTVAFGLAAATAGVLGGLVAAIGLEVSSTFRTARLSVRTSAAIGDPTRSDLTTSVGPAVGFGLAALALAAVAAVLLALPPRHRRTAPAGGGTPPHPADEELADGGANGVLVPDERSQVGGLASPAAMKEQP